MAANKSVHIQRQDVGDVCGGSFSSAQIMSELLPHFEKMREAGGGMPLSGLSSGFKDLDWMIDGFHPGELIVIAARPGMGKRQFVWQIAMHVACELQQSVAYFSTTTSRAVLLKNMTAFAAQVDLNPLGGSQPNEKAWQCFTSAAQKIANSPLIINDSSADPGVIRKEAKLLCESDHAPSLVIVDKIPAQIDKNNGIHSRCKSMSNMSADIYRIARDNGIPVIALASISRDVESRKCKYPLLTDLASADGLRWYADTVITLYRDVVYNRDTNEKDTTHITILKSFYGSGGGFDLHRSGDGKFASLPV